MRAAAASLVLAFLLTTTDASASVAEPSGPAVTFALDGAKLADYPYRSSLDGVGSTYRPDFVGAVGGRLGVEYSPVGAFAGRATLGYGKQWVSKGTSSLKWVTVDLIRRFQRRSFDLSLLVRMGMQWTTWSGVDAIRHANENWIERDITWRGALVGMAGGLRYRVSPRLATYAEVAAEYVRIGNMHVDSRGGQPAPFDVDVSGGGPQVSATLLGVSVLVWR